MSFIRTKKPTIRANILYEEYEIKIKYLSCYDDKHYDDG